MCNVILIILILCLQSLGLIHSTQAPSIKTLTNEELTALIHNFYMHGNDSSLMQNYLAMFHKKSPGEDNLPPELADLFPSFFDSVSSLPHQNNGSSFNLNEQREAEVIIVHGTFAANFDWYKQDGDFYDAVLFSAKERFGDNATIFSYCWSGSLGCMARIEAATSLAEHILMSDKRTYTIGHSHGGNVINLASQILELAQEVTDKKEHCEKMASIAQKLFEKEKNELLQWQNTRHISWKSPSLEEIRNRLFSSILSVASAGFMHQEGRLSRGLAAKDVSELLIEENFLLATPVDTVDLSPSAKIIKQSFNIFSKNDMVQPIFGLYGRTYGFLRDIVTDISVIFGETDVSDREGLVYNYPSHTDLHSVDVGKVLLLIPKICNEASSDLYKSNGDLFDLVIYKGAPRLQPPVLKTVQPTNPSALGAILETFQDFASWFI